MGAAGPNWIEVTPASVAISSVQECRRHLEQASDKPIRVFHAAADANRALQAALTAALAGSANIGASPPKLRGEWLRWFEETSENRSSKTPSWRVMGLREMLLEAVSNRLPWAASPLELSAQESFWIGRLAFYRDSFEHAKQLTFLMTTEEVADSIDGSIEVVHRALQTLTHQLYDELEGLAVEVKCVRKLARQLASVR